VIELSALNFTIIFLQLFTAGFDGPLAGNCNFR
jgi:hypothetical protein